MPNSAWRISRVPTTIVFLTNSRLKEISTRTRASEARTPRHASRFLDLPKATRSSPCVKTEFFSKPWGNSESIIWKMTNLSPTSSIDLNQLPIAPSLNALFANQLKLARLTRLRNTALRHPMPFWDPPVITTKWFLSPPKTFAALAVLLKFQIFRHGSQ